MNLEFLIKIDEEKIKKKTRFFCGYENVMNESKNIVDMVLGDTKLSDDISIILGINGTMLFEGSPGEGKSTIAYNIAKYALDKYEVECYQISVTDIIKSELGKAAYNTHKALKEIEKIGRSNGAIIFIDEIDRLCVNRKDNRESSEMKRVLIELMDFLDDLSINNKLVVIATTNIANDLDEALLRRFDYRKTIKSDSRLNESFILLLNKELDINIDRKLIEKYCKTKNNLNCDYIKKIYKNSFLKFYNKKDCLMKDLEAIFRKGIEDNVNGINKC